MSNIHESKENMSAFMSELMDAQRADEAAENMRHSRQYIWNTIREKQDAATRNVATEVFLTIYKNALPLDPHHKEVFGTALRDRAISYVKKNHGCDVFDYIDDCGKKGSIPAAHLCQVARDKVGSIYQKYYEDSDVNPDDIDPDAGSDALKDVVGEVSASMSADEVSAIIEQNVKDTIAREIAITKDEDEKLANLENSLAEDDNVITEGGIEAAMISAGFTPNSIYKPSLFNGIMIGSIENLKDSDMSGQDKQKQAYYESVQELTMLQMLNTFGMIDINVNNVDKIASKYAMGY